MPTVSQGFRSAVPLAAAVLAAILATNAFAQGATPPGIDRDAIRNRDRVALDPTRA